MTTDHPAPRPPEPEPVLDRGGDPACWLPRVCPECGRLAEVDPPTACARCGTRFGDDEE